MLRITATLVALGLSLGSASSSMAQSLRIAPRPTPSVDGTVQMTIKRIPEGREFLLTVNKGQDISYFQLQWYKDGVRLDGETGQELRRPIASYDLNGMYTVEMSSPCATVMSNPMQVIVGRTAFGVNSQVAPQGVAGGVDEWTGPTFELVGCQPNPVSDRTTISFTTNQEAPVHLSLIDLNGQVIATLVNETLPAARHEIVLNPQTHNLANGTYFVVMNAPGFSASKSLIVAR